MELIDERELGIVGERYGSFLEAYRVNDRRSLNAQVAGRGDGSSQGLVEADGGIVFAPEETRRALLYGSDLYAGRYKEMRKRVRKTLSERYEWMDEDRFGADVRGEHVIMERYAIGHPEAFHRKRKTERRERSVEILYDAMCPASTPVAKRIEAGCIVAACADALERIGYEVALTFCLATYDGNSMSEDPTLLLEVALKGYGDALNVKRLEFPLAAKPVLFHLGVWWAHRFPGARSDFGAGEGYPVSYDARRVRAMEEHARRRHGAYLSEDIIEMQLGMDPTRALERILGAVGEADVLEQHMAGKSTMQASESPAQGKLFGGVRGSVERPGEGGSGDEADAAGAAGGPRGTGLSGPGRPGSDGAGDGAGPGSDDELKGTVPFSSSGGGAHDAQAASGPAADAGSDGGASASARKPAGEGHRSSDDVEPGSDGATGFGGLTGDLDAGQRAANGAPAADGEAGGEAQAGGDAESVSGADADGVSDGSMTDGELGGQDGSEGASGAGDGSASASSGDGASSPSSAGNADSPGGGGAGGKRPRDDEDEAGNDEDEDDDQGEPMSGDTNEQEEQRDSDDTSRSEEQSSEDERSEHDADDDDEEQERECESFIVELRKRYVRFERGDYRRMKEKEARASEPAASATGSDGNANRRPVQAPPIAPVTGADDYEFGTPRSTPFSMNYVPKRKG